MFQPLPVQHQSHVDTLDGDERRQPEDQSTGGDEEIVEELAEQRVERRSIGDVQGEMSETSDEHAEIELIDQAETQKIVTNTVAQTDRLSKGDEGEEIVGHGKEKGQERDEKGQRQGG